MSGFLVYKFRAKEWLFWENGAFTRLWDDLAWVPRLLVERAALGVLAQPGKDHHQLISTLLFTSSRSIEGQVRNRCDVQYVRNCSKTRRIPKFQEIHKVRQHSAPSKKFFVDVKIRYWLRVRIRAYFFLNKFVISSVVSLLLVKTSAFAFVQ
jgi:hypothetical protein